MNSLITVIIPVFNGERTISRCLHSVIHQTYQNLEIVIINDGSTDQTSLILESFKDVDNRLVVLTQSNQGVSAARNYGVSMAHGSFICFVDGDDTISTNFIEYLAAKQLETKSDVVECGVIIQDTNGEVIRYEQLKNKCIELTEDIKMKYLTQSNQLNYVCNKMFRKQTIEGIFFPNLSSGEDFVFLNRVFERCEKYCSIENNLYHYIINNNSATQSTFSIRQLDSVIAGELVLMENIEVTKYVPLIAKYILEKIYTIYYKTYDNIDDEQRRNIQKELKIKFKKYLKLVSKEQYVATNSLYRRKHYMLFRVSPLLAYYVLKLAKFMKGNKNAN